MNPEPGSAGEPAPSSGAEAASSGAGAGEASLDREALERALRFIEYRPRSSGETKDRLGKWGYSHSCCRAVMDYLEKCGLIDDMEFGRVFLGEMLRKNLGYNRIRFELFRKKLDRQTIAAVMEGYPREGELARAVAAAAPFARRLAGRRPAEAARSIAASLVRRGYPGAVARRAAELALDVDTENWRE